jgi:hypothetical protein
MLAGPFKQTGIVGASNRGLSFVVYVTQKLSFKIVGTFDFLSRNLSRKNSSFSG